jgi:nicotinamidase/pyrazinamidase
MEASKMKTIGCDVDTLNDFMSALGKLYVPGAETIEPSLDRAIQYLRNRDMTILHLADCHDENSRELAAKPDFMKTFPEHCMRGTWGAEFILATKPIKPYVIDWTDKSIDLERLATSKEIVLRKDYFDVFRGNPFADGVLKALAPDRVIVYGVATNVCVDFAVRGLLERGKEVYVVEDAIKDLPNIPSPVEDWKSMGVRLIRTDDLYNI